MRLVAGGETVTARYVVGADGATGATARLAGVAPVSRTGAPAIEVELAVPDAVRARYADAIVVTTVFSGSSQDMDLDYTLSLPGATPQVRTGRGEERHDTARVPSPHTGTRKPRPMTAQQITKGATVYGTGGEKVGTIQAYNAQGGYLVVRTGWPFPTDLHIPLYAFRETDAHGDVHLGLRTGEPRDDRNGDSERM